MMDVGRAVDAKEAPLDHARTSHTFDDLISVGGLSRDPSFKDEDDDEPSYESIVDDVYNMFFLSGICGPAFWYATYVFLLKMGLYTFLQIDVTNRTVSSADDEVDTLVLAAQFLILPVAVAMQEDLMSTYYLIANVKYCPSIENQCPHARRWKFHVATFFRGADGVYSLLINFLVLVTAREVLSLFLNFAALQFLQTIDNLALDMAANGYLFDNLEEIAKKVQEAKLPKKHNECFRALDSVFFLTTLIALVIGWCVIQFA